jgi:hypothetical protein
MKRTLLLISSLIVLLAVPTGALSVGTETAVEESSDVSLAQELTHPLADLITIPVQMNYDQALGPVDDGWKLQTSFQPVIPFHLTKDWNLISRTILPVIYREIEGA